MGMLDSLNASVNKSFVGKYFEMEARNTNCTTELRGAVATFLTMAYILAVNPRILADSGGPCVPDDENGGIFSPAYEQCLEDIKREFITSTAIASMVGCFLMGIMANLPIALAPGMGMNAYFTYSVVGWRGTGETSYDAAVTAVLIEGAIFTFLAVTGIRYAIVKMIPEPVRTATPAAIGAFLAHLGLQTAEGIGVVVSDIATAVTLGGCPVENRTPIVAFTEACQADKFQCVTSDAYTCDDLGGVMTSATAWVGIGGLMITAIMLAYKNNLAFVVGIGFITAISWFRNTSITYFPDDDAGDDRFEYFKQIVSIESIDKLFAPYSSDLAGAGVALVTFLYVDFLDTSGTLLALATSMGYVDEEGNFPRSKWAFAADALATMFGSLFGLSPVTSFIEAGAGVQAGARTGLCAVFCGIFFFISIFFAPIIASIPPWASGGALIIVGAMMAKSLGQIKWHIPSHALSAFLTVIIMPLTYSIAYGLIAGICSYFIMEGTYVLLALVGIAKPVYEDPYAVEAASTEEVVGDEAVVDPDDDKTKTAAGDGSDENSEEVPEGGEAESAVEQATEESKPTV